MDFLVFVQKIIAEVAASLATCLAEEAVAHESDPFFTFTVILPEEVENINEETIKECVSGALKAIVMHGRAQFAISGGELHVLITHDARIDHT